METRTYYKLDFPNFWETFDDSNGRREKPCKCGVRGICCDLINGFGGDTIPVESCSNKRVTRRGATDTITNMVQNALVQGLKMVVGVSVGENFRNE